MKEMAAAGVMYLRTPANKCDTQFQTTTTSGFYE
jgi:hypothetical protein